MPLCAMFLVMRVWMVGDDDNICETYTRPGQALEHAFAMVPSHGCQFTLQR